MTHLMLDDELDEQDYAPLQGHTRTMIWDVSRLDRPILSGNFYSEETSIGESYEEGWSTNLCHHGFSVMLLWLFSCFFSFKSCAL